MEIRQLLMSAPPTPTPLKINSQDQVTGSPPHMSMFSENLRAGNVCVCVFVCVRASGVYLLEQDDELAVGGAKC